MAKVLITVPEGLLRDIDREVSRRGTSRSHFMQAAAERELGWPDPATIDAALARGRAALASAGTFESTDLIAQERRSRDAIDRRR